MSNIKRIVLIDIGNSKATVGFYEAGRLKDFRSIDYAAIPKYVQKFIKSGSDKQYEIVISSVRPKISTKLRHSILRHKGTKVWVVGRNLPVRIKHKYNNYSKLGVDRKVNAYGVIKIYKSPMLILDFGTALTLGYVDKSMVFQGGLIAPGPSSAYRSLIESGELLPKNAEFPIYSGRSIIAKDTVSNLETGILEGYGAMVDGLARLNTFHLYDAGALYGELGEACCRIVENH